MIYFKSAIENSKFNSKKFVGVVQKVMFTYSAIRIDDTILIINQAFL